MGDRMGSSPINRTIKKTTFVYHDKGCFFVLSDQNTGKSSKNQAKTGSGAADRLLRSPIFMPLVALLYYLIIHGGVEHD